MSKKITIEKLNYSIGYNKESTIIEIDGYRNNFFKALVTFKTEHNADYMLFFDNFVNSRILLTFKQEDLSFLFKLLYSDTMDKEPWGDKKKPLFNFVHESDVRHKIYFDPSYGSDNRNLYSTIHYHSISNDSFINQYKNFVGKSKLEHNLKCTIKFNYHRDFSVYKLFNKTIYNDVTDTIITDVTNCQYGTSKYIIVDYWCKSHHDRDLIEEKRNNIPLYITEEKEKMKIHKQESTIKKDEF